MSFNFGSQKNDPIFGTYGEFAPGSIGSSVKAQFLFTKVCPGNKGSWENLLLSEMVPWREIFNDKDLPFDEMVHRNLDDSRVAYELIPYLLGEGKNVMSASFSLLFLQFWFLKIFNSLEFCRTTRCHSKKQKK